MTIFNTSELSIAIKELELKKKQQDKELIEQFTKTYESIKPVNLINRIITDTANKPGVVDNILNFSIGVGAGLATKKMYVGKSNSIFKKIIGSAIEYGVTNLVTANGGFIKQKGMELLLNFFNKNKANKK